MENDLSLDDDEDIDSEENSKNINNKDSSFRTENIVNYGKDYQKLEKIYSKKEIMTFNKLLEYKKLNKLNVELDLYKKETINWKYIYNNVFKMILLPINLNKIDINKTITIHEISQRMRYCIHCISTIKDKNNIQIEKNYAIPKIIDIFSNDKKKHKKNYRKFNKDKDMKRSNSHDNFIYEDNKKIIDIDKEKSNKECVLNALKDNNNNKNKDNENINNDTNIKNENKTDIINNNTNNNNEKKKNNRRRENKGHVTIIMGKKSEEKLKSKNPLINKNNSLYHSYRKKKKMEKNIILENMEKKNDAHDNEIKNIPKMSDNNLFEIKQKKQDIPKKRNAYIEAMTEFNLKNLNMEIKDKTFCENFAFFPAKQNYDKDNDLEKRGNLILSYKKMTDNLIDLLNL